MNALIVTIAVAALAGAAAAVLVFRFARLRGTRLVTCPETSQMVAVDVAAWRGAVRMPWSKKQLDLRNCSRWPEKRDCGQECVRQIEAAPRDCLVSNTLTRWYAGKSCALCAKPFGEIRWADYRPAITPDSAALDRKLLEWSTIPVDRIPEVMASHEPVCWRCYAEEVLHPFRAHHKVEHDAARMN